MEVIKSFDFNGKKLSVYGTIDEPLFKASDIGSLLDIKNIRTSIETIPKEFKHGVHVTDSVGRRNKCTFLTEQGLYMCAFKSEKPIAKQFTIDVTKILKEIRLTGSYNSLKPKTVSDYHVMYITNETELQKNIIKFLRQHQEKYNLKIVVPLGELQDSPEKRMNSKQMGYDKGQPDIIINNASIHHDGLIIELKSPNGKGELSNEQIKIIKMYKDDNFKVIVSNDLCEIIRRLTIYFTHIRIRCKYCSRKFKSVVTRKKHIKFFHKIRV